VGLDAVVYVHKDNLPLNIREDLPSTDNETGEVYFEDAKLARKYPKKVFTAIYKNLGNVAMIADLRSKISPAIGPDSILVSKVLYSGSHSGDIIGLSDLGHLESEINVVRDKTSTIKSAALRNFLGDLTDLIITAKTQRNPIVFV
jgi:hypothetical protein